MLTFFTAANAAAFESLPKDGDEGNAVFCGPQELPILRVLADGTIHWRNGKLTRLPTEKTEMLDWVWVQNHTSGLYVTYEATDRTADGSSGKVCKFIAPGAMPQWCTHIPAFNIVVSISNTSSFYVAGIGMAARIDLQTGKYLWKVDGLYEKDRAFNSFLIPIEQDADVAFYASAGTKSAQIKRLVLNRNTGSVMSLSNVSDSSEVPADFPRLVRGCNR